MLFVRHNIMNQQSSHKQLLFFLPISFQSISFHHKSKYYIQITPLPPSTPIRMQLSAKNHSQILRPRRDHHGNTFNVGSNIHQSSFRTNKFEIEYNDQLIYFHTALMAELNARHQFTLKIELIRFQDTEGSGEQRKRINPAKETVVAMQELVINTGMCKQLLAINHFNYRRVVFPTSQYISSLDFALQVVSLGPTHHHSPSRNPYERSQDKENVIVESSSRCGVCCNGQESRHHIDPARQIEQLYQLTIMRKLQVYRSLKVKTDHLIDEYITYIHEPEPSRRSDDDNYFQRKYLDPQVIDLDYVALEPVLRQKTKKQRAMEISAIPSANRTPSQLIQDQSSKPINQQLSIQLQPHHQMSFIARLCQHYQCDPQQISQHLSEESQLLDLNIRNVFNRLTQLQFTLAPFSTRIIIENQAKRVMTFLFQCQLWIRKQNHLYKLPQSHQEQITQLYPRYQMYTGKMIKELTNHFKVEEKQPLILTTNEPQQPRGQSLPLEQTVTVMVHGYKGSQYDLSKVKAYLATNLGMHQFCALKSLSGDDKTKGTLDSLGQIAANQLNQYLKQNPNIRHINIVCFSMGGVIARAMLPRLQQHRHKFNLLMTLASPHLGVREVQSCVVRAGMMLIRRLGQVDAIKQLNVERNEGQSRYLHDISTGEGLQWFNSVILVGGVDDSYIPLYSSIVDYQGESEMIQDMCQNLQRVLKKAIKCSVKLEYDEGVWDIITQRAAHIGFLQEDCFIKTLLVKFKSYFVRAIKL